MKVLDQITAKKKELREAKAIAFRKENENALLILKQVETFLRPVLQPEDFIFGSEYFRIERAHPEYSYQKEMFTVQVSNGWNQKEWKVGLNYYTGGDIMSDWELTRLETLGKVAALLRDHKQDLINSLNNLDLHKDIRVEVYKIENELRALENLQREEEKQKAINHLLSGEVIEFETPEYITLGFSHETRAKKIQVIEQTSSGKTVVVMVWYNDYRGDEVTFTSKVRLSTLLTSSLVQAIQEEITPQYLVKNIVTETV